jgi:hypothetical protein
MRVSSYHTQPSGLRVETSEGTLQLIPYTPNIVRVRYALQPPPSERESLMIVAQPAQGSIYQVQETAHLLIFTTSVIEIQIQKVYWP